MLSSDREVVCKLVLDVLKPHNPSIVDLAKSILKVAGVKHVRISVQEVDVNTETVKIVVEGEGFDFEKLKKVIENLGAVIHSIDEVVIRKV
ncbi:MAG: hypothetical protein DRJ40_05165 [Thermoprotei archaeon]|nr:MAG: hypothetical protein DRJ40_04360 [Thermoprotei archaeon]RLE56787.1 MAG: hypothetical protein DRJ40_05165 [Thermoprotei archaeon]